MLEPTHSCTRFSAHCRFTYHSLTTRGKRVVIKSIILIARRLHISTHLDPGNSSSLKSRIQTYDTHRHFNLPLQKKVSHPILTHRTISITPNPLSQIPPKDSSHTTYVEPNSSRSRAGLYPLLTLHPWPIESMHLTSVDVRPTNFQVYVSLEAAIHIRLIPLLIALTSVFPVDSCLELSL
ncbi:hypothetical protein K435DRAFT_280430 [Dendrothele bispora CBS 962.96]|uniref:Uncharacterized protein n=1 Tax=Dendrothele bispora (strain CBS 962.96) TaxID=1314807 RepID=A0A4S8ML55_DENBC|nr:hypothetical protein K435DRAFT_280430 [Dendrothele bispora CBS 962.96]